MAAPWFSRARNGARNLFGPTQNNNANRARRNALKQALTVYAQSSNYKSYITAARTLNSLFVNVPKNNREYTKGLGVLRVTAGTTPGNIRRKINERLGLNRSKFLKNALINKNVTNKNLKNVFGPNVNLSYRLYSSRFQTNLASARTIQNLNKLEANIPRNHPNANNYRTRISNKRNQLKPPLPNIVTPPNNVKPPLPNIVSPPNNNRNRGGGSSTVTGIGKLKIQIGTGNSNLRKRLENLERAKANAEKAKENAKKANVNANTRPGNANAARANANAARAALEAMKKELEALTAAKMAAETEKANLQGKLETAQATGANVNSLRRAYANAQNAATRMESNFKAKLTEATAEAEKARANANTAKANAATAASAAAKANATAAEHLAAKEASNKAASEASNAASAALAAKAAMNTQYALAQLKIKAITANKNATNAEKSAAIANAAAARARMAQANARARNAEAARLSATSAATAAMRKASANVAEVRLQLEAAQKNAASAAARAANANARASAANATIAQQNAALTASEEAVQKAGEAARLAQESAQAARAELQTRSATQVNVNAVKRAEATSAALQKELFRLRAVANANKKRFSGSGGLTRGTGNNNAFKRQAEAEALASQYSSTGLVRGVAPNVTNTSRGKYLSSGLKPYRNRYNIAMANQNVGSKKQLLLKLQENLLSFTPNNTTRNNKRQLSLNIRNSLSGLETLGEQTSRYTAFALGESTRTKHSNRNRAGFNKWIASMNRGITRGNTDTQSRLNRLKQQAQRNRNASRITNQNLKNILEEHARLTQRFQNKQAEISLGQL